MIQHQDTTLESFPVHFWASQLSAAQKEQTGWSQLGTLLVPPLLFCSSPASVSFSVSQG